MMFTIPRNWFSIFIKKYFENKWKFSRNLRFPSNMIDGCPNPYHTKQDSNWSFVYEHGISSCTMHHASHEGKSQISRKFTKLFKIFFDKNGKSVARDSEHHIYPISRDDIAWWSVVNIVVNIFSLLCNNPDPGATTFGILPKCACGMLEWCV